MDSVSSLCLVATKCSKNYDMRSQNFGSKWKCIYNVRMNLILIIMNQPLTNSCYKYLNSIDFRVYWIIDFTKINDLFVMKRTKYRCFRRLLFNFFLLRLFHQIIMMKSFLVFELCSYSWHVDLKILSHACKCLFENAKFT